MVFWNETKAIEDVKNMSEDARLHLQDRLRNGLQSILSQLETGTKYEVRHAVFDMADELRRLGL